MINYNKRNKLLKNKKKKFQIYVLMIEMLPFIKFYTGKDYYILEKTNRNYKIERYNILQKQERSLNNISKLILY